MARKLVVEIVGDSRSLERAFARSSRSAKNFNRDISHQVSGTVRATRSLAGTVTGLGAGFLGLAGAGLVIREAFSEMADAQKVSAQTAAVLESTGSAANVTAKQVEGLAESLMRLSGVDDEAIQAGENMLLTFTKVRNEVGQGNNVFDRATRAALDMSVALGKDMTQSSLQLGKALNDPVRGVTALRRSGVQFTRGQEKLIRSLVASRQQLRAQKIILAEVTREFGGSARAAGETLPGKINILQESLRNLGGTIAEGLAPEFTKFVDKFNEWIAKPENQKRVIDDLEEGGRKTGKTLRFLGGALDWTTDKLDAYFNESQRIIDRDAKRRGIAERGFLSGLLGTMESGVVGGWAKRTKDVLDAQAKEMAVDVRQMGQDVGTAFNEGFGETAMDHRALMKIRAARRRGEREAAAATPAARRPGGVTAAQRNQWFDTTIARQLNRLQDSSLRKQLAQLRQVAQEVRARLGVTQDATRRLTLEDKLLDIYRQQKSVQSEIGANIRSANEALKERADAIKSAILERLQARQTNVENRRALRDAQERLRIARQLGTARGIRTAREALADVNADLLMARIQAQPARLTKGGQFGLGNIVTINIHGVTDPEAVARRVDEILKRRRRRTTTQSRPTAAGQAA